MLSNNKPATHKATFLKGEGLAGDTLLNPWVDVVNKSTHKKQTKKKNKYPNPETEKHIPTQWTNIRIVEYPRTTKSVMQQRSLH